MPLRINLSVVTIQTVAMEMSKLIALSLRYFSLTSAPSLLIVPLNQQVLLAYIDTRKCGKSSVGLNAN